MRTIIIIIVVIICIIILLFKFQFIGSWEYFSNILKKKPAENITNLERKRRLKDHIAKVIPAIEKDGIDIFSQFGTLLGLYREGDIICYDYDADFCILSKDWSKLKKSLRSFLKENNDFDWIFFDIPFISNVLLYNKITGAYMDISVRAIRNGKTYRKIPMKEKEIPLTAIFPLKRIKLPDTDIYVSIPHDPDIFLQSWYGPNYMIPDKKCNEECEQCVVRN